MSWWTGTQEPLRGVMDRARCALGMGWIGNGIRIDCDYGHAFRPTHGLERYARRIFPPAFCCSSFLSTDYLVVQVDWAKKKIITTCRCADFQSRRAYARARLYRRSHATSPLLSSMDFSSAGRWTNRCSKFSPLPYQWQYIMTVTTLIQCQKLCILTWTLTMERGRDFDALRGLLWGNAD